MSDLLILIIRTDITEDFFYFCDQFSHFNRSVEDVRTIGSGFSEIKDDYIYIVYMTTDYSRSMRSQLMEDISSRIKLSQIATINRIEYLQGYLKLRNVKRIKDVGDIIGVDSREMKLVGEWPLPGLREAIIIRIPGDELVQSK